MNLNFESKVLEFWNLEFLVLKFKTWKKMKLKILKIQNLGI